MMPCVRGSRRVSESAELGPFSARESEKRETSPKNVEKFVEILWKNFFKNQKKSW